MKRINKRSRRADAAGKDEWKKQNNIEQNGKGREEIYDNEDKKVEDMDG